MPQLFGSFVYQKKGCAGTGFIYKKLVRWGRCSSRRCWGDTEGPGHIDPEYANEALDSHLFSEPEMGVAELLVALDPCIHRINVNIVFLRNLRFIPH